MNAVEFKEKLEKSKEADLLKFLSDYKEEWGESLESTIDKILEKHANDKDTKEPFEINEINCKLLTRQGEWEVIDEMPDMALRRQPSCEYQLYRGDKYDYRHNVCVSYVKRKWFGHKVIHTDEFYRRIYQKDEYVLYGRLNSLQKTCFKKILTDKGFFTSRTLNRLDARLDVYWNKDQYDQAMK